MRLEQLEEEVDRRERVGVLASTAPIAFRLPGSRAAVGSPVVVVPDAHEPVVQGDRPESD